MSKIIPHIVEDLKNVSTKSDVSYKHAAAIISRKNIWSIGHNYHLQYKSDITLHAELDAIIQFKNKYKYIKKFEGLDIIILRFSRQEQVLNYSKPCEGCLKILRKFNFNRVFYSNQEGHIVYEYLSNMHTTHRCSGQRKYVK